VVVQLLQLFLILSNHPVSGRACCWTANFSSHASGVRFSRIHQPPVARYASLTGG